MKNALRVLCFSLIAAHSGVAAEPAGPVAVATHYQLRVGLDLREHTIDGDVAITLRNSGKNPLTSVRFILYRLMDIQSARDSAGKALRFSQKVVKFSDEPTWQVNAIEVTLPAALPPGKTTKVHLTYRGPLLGMREIMQYVRDTVSDDYSLLRAEPIPYPMLSEASYSGWMQFLRSEFGFEIETVVPAGYVVVCVVPDVGKHQTKEGKATYRCAGEGNGSSINVAVAKFHVLKDVENGLQVYSLPAESEASQRIMDEMRRALDFFRSYLGDVHSGGLTLIEIPEGWGSYALPGYIFQTPGAFHDKDRAHELWHEVAHRWNACRLSGDRACSRAVLRSRWFDEAFASYFEALAMRHFLSEEAFRDCMESYRKTFVRRSEKNPLGRTTPIMEYGKYEIGDFSYNKGAWSLHVLHWYLGEEAFRKAVADFLAQYRDRPADFEAFKRAVQESSGRDLDRWFQQWIAAGPESSGMLIQGKKVEEMAAEAGAK